MERKNISIGFLLFFLVSFSGHSQNDASIFTRKDTLKSLHRSTIYHLVQRSWIANQEPSYASVLPFVPSIKERRVPLRQGEGMNTEFSLLEANLNLSFPLFFGTYRNWINKDNETVGFHKRHRITFDYNGNFRMSLDDSKPIFPSNNRVGLSWYLNLFNSQTGWIHKDRFRDRKISTMKKNLSFLNALMRFHHFSNGQAGDFFYSEEENNQDAKRNNYRAGDFSTNYLYWEATYGWYDINEISLHQISLGYRSDFGTEEGTLAFSEEQIRTYGKKRLSLKYDHRTTKNSNNMQFHFRGEFGYILGNLDWFVPNLVDNKGNTDTGKYRFNMRGLFELAPDNHRTIGYFFSIYYGRDYMNIRYDDIIFSTQLGVTLSLDKFFMPNLKSEQ